MHLIKTNYLVFVFLFHFAKCQNSEFSRGLETLKDHLVSDLGLTKEPDVEKAVLSDQEYQKMYKVYNEMLRQADEIKKIRKRFKKMKFTTPTKHVFYLDKEQSHGLMAFDMQTFKDLEYGSTFVNSAQLKLKLKRTSHILLSNKISLSQIIDGQEGTIVDSVSINDDFEEIISVTFDVSDTVQAWYLDKESQRGLKIDSEGFEVIVSDEESPVINVDSILSLTRHRRSVGLFHLKDDVIPDADSSQDCTGADNRCCRDDMVVNLRELEGFNFILEPTEFNAFMCRGKCPARYKPLNDHSLLQSLMHIRHQQEALEAADQPSNKVKRPCCVPSKLASLPILHLDENNPSKLKVTTWKSIIVTECACA